LLLESGFPLIGAVGRLQFEVLEYRLKDEYGVISVLAPLPYECSSWLFGDISTLKKPHEAKLVKDQYDRPILLFTRQWDKDYAVRQNPDIVFRDYA